MDAEGVAPSAGGGCGVVVFFALAAAFAVAVVLGSFAPGTTRAYGGGGPDAGSTWEEGAGRWAIWTFPCGLAALGALCLVGWATIVGHRGLGAILVGPVAPFFALAALLAGRNWLRLLAERGRERDYTLTIAAGLPIVTLTAATGALVALLLAVALLVHRR